MDAQTTTESGSVMATKLAPPAIISITSLLGYSLPDLLVLATLVYTLLMIIHKLYKMAVEVYYRHFRGDQRTGEADTRDCKIERRDTNDE